MPTWTIVSLHLSSVKILHNFPVFDSSICQADLGDMGLVPVVIFCRSISVGIARQPFLLPSAHLCIMTSTVPVGSLNPIPVFPSHGGQQWEGEIRTFS